MDANSRPTVGQEQAAEVEQYLDYLESVVSRAAIAASMVLLKLCRQEHRQPRDRFKPQMARARGRHIALWCLVPQAAVRSRKDQRPTKIAYSRILSTYLRGRTDP